MKPFARLVLLFAMLGAPLLSAQTHSNTLSWLWSQGTGDPATGFHIWRAAGTSAPVTTGTPYATVTPSTVLTYVDTAVAAGNTFTYVITAFNAGGDSTPSNSATCVTPFSPPTSPTTLSGTVK
jgi:hypothetical protein